MLAMLSVVLDGAQPSSVGQWHRLGSQGPRLVGAGIGFATSLFFSSHFLFSSSFPLLMPFGSLFHIFQR